MVHQRIASIVSLVFSLAVVLFPTGAQGAQWRTVRWVDDGDTVVLSDGTKVRYIGINAPETQHEDKLAERFGPEAKAFNRKLVYRKTVRLELDREKHDQYGRLLAHVFLEDGMFVNAQLVKTGHAYFVFRRPNTRYNERLLRLQREAMGKKAGLWKGMIDQAGPYLGNRRSKRFHRRDCYYGKRIAPKNRVSFEKKYDAFWEGYSPCKRCNP